MKKETHTQPDLYELLNKAFSANYTCLRIANQDEPFSGEQIKGRNELFKRKTLKEVWLTGKMKDAAEDRISLLNAYAEAKRISFEDFDMVKEDQKNKELLMSFFNRYYETNKTYEECFDGFEILDEDFKAIFELFDGYRTLPATRLGMNMLLNIYYSYLNYWTDRTFVLAASDIIDTLSDDLNSSGYRTFYYGKPRNPDVTVITKSEIESLILKAHDFIVAFEKESKEKRKQSDALLKAIKKTSSSENQQKYFELQVELTRLSLVEEKMKALSYFLTVLNNRLSASGKDLESSKILQFGEGLLDLTTGINVFDEKNRLKVETTYIHALEIKYLTFLFKSLGLENPLNKNNNKQSIENQKQ